MKALRRTSNIPFSNAFSVLGLLKMMCSLLDLALPHAALQFAPKEMVCSLFAPLQGGLFRKPLTFGGCNLHPEQNCVRSLVFARRKVKFVVLLDRQSNKIGRVIVRAIPVDVMDVESTPVRIDRNFAVCLFVYASVRHEQITG